MLAHVQPGVHQDFQVLFCRAALQLGSSQPAMVHVVPPQVQDFALCLVEHSEILVSLLSSLLRSLWMATWPSYHIHSSQFGVIHKLAEGIHCSIIYISKILNRTGLNIEKPLGTSRNWPPTRLCHWSPCSGPSHSGCSQSASRSAYPVYQLLYEDVMGHHGKSLTGDKINNIHCSPLTQWFHCRWLYWSSMTSPW